MANTIHQADAQLPKRITASWLHGLGACVEAVEEFSVVFPTGATPSAASIRKALKAELNITWLIENVMPLKARLEWRSEREAIEAKWWSERKALDAKILLKWWRG